MTLASIATVPFPAMLRARSSFPPAPRAAQEWNAWDGVLILDACARIRFCSTAAAALLGGTPRTLIGEPVTRLFPDLPFGRYTPEFNLAYVFFHGNDGVWTRRSLRTGDGREVPVEVSLASQEEFGGRAIVLIVRAPSDNDLPTPAKENSA